jgi:hypothetical protein
MFDYAVSTSLAFLQQNLQVEPSHACRLGLVFRQRAQQSTTAGPAFDTSWQERTRSQGRERIPCQAEAGRPTRLALCRVRLAAQGQRIPDVQKTFNVPIVGSFELLLSDLTVTSFSCSPAHANL